MVENVVPKETTNADLKASGEGIVDDVLDKAFAGEETAEESTTSKETKSEETEVSKEAGENQQKKSTEETKEKSEDKDLPKDVQYRKNWNRLKEERDQAKREAEELKKNSLSKEEVEQVRQITSSPEYIRLSMKAQGYADEAINSKLKEAGHPVNDKVEDSLGIVLTRLGIDTNNLSQEQKDYVNTYISDVVKVADILIQDRLGKVLPTQLKPIQEQLAKHSQTETAKTYVSQMQEMVKTEGILDFEKDVEPLLDKFIEENPEVNQENVLDYFYDLNHSLTIERLKGGKKQDERTAAKKDLRSLPEGAKTTKGLPNWDQSKTAGDNVGDLLTAAGIR